MELIYTDVAHEPKGSLMYFNLDAAFGDSENDFLLTVPQGVDIEPGALVYEYGTDVGGVVDSKGFDNTKSAPFVTYGGRTWHGILNASITRPDSGQAYLTLTGDINAAIGTIIARAGLEAVFAPSQTSAGVPVSFQVPRYVSAWEAVRMLCRAYGKRPDITKRGGLAVIEAVDAGNFVDGRISDLTVSTSVERVYRPVNHLVLLGKGELASRLVRDVYADASGNVSRNQTFFGVDEVAEVYELSNEESSSKLIDEGTKRLKSLQQFANIDIAVPSGPGYQIGDTLKVYSVDTGITATAEIVKKVVTVDDNGDELTNYELGEPIINTYL